MNKATTIAARTCGRAARSAVLTSAGLCFALSACSSTDVTVEDAQQACSEQLERAGVSDISWTASEETKDGYAFSGDGAGDGGTVEVECEIDSDGTVRRTSSGSPQ